MKKTIAISLALCICLGLFACGEQKSAEANKADELIQAIGEVTADSEAAILAAQNYYDSLTQSQKEEVEYYDILVFALEKLPQKKLEQTHSEVLDLIAQGNFIEASCIVYEHPEFWDYDELVISCGKGILGQYIKSNGEEEAHGIYEMKLVENSNTTIVATHYEAGSDLIALHRLSLNYGIIDSLSVRFVPGSGILSFSRDTTALTTKTHHQEGSVNLEEYTGTMFGTIVENSTEPFGIYGLTTTTFETIYNSPGKGYQQGTMLYINECLDAIFKAVADAGYSGTSADLGFPVYKSE